MSENCTPAIQTSSVFFIIPKKSANMKTSHDWALIRMGGMLAPKVWIQSVEYVLTMVPQLFDVHLPRLSSRSRVPTPRDW